jgi:glyoxylase-like metal-dependent hydrolase (beta-lactamase superfamily II)
MQDVLNFGPVTVHTGARAGKYPEGNQVIVRGGDTRAAFDTALVSNRIGPDFDTVDLVILGHVHEDHMAGLHRVPRASVQVHEADLQACRSWEGLGRHYGYPPEVLARMHALLLSEFHYHPRPDATAYADGAAWDLGGGVRVRAHHMPGHTAGHCVLVEESTGVAFIGDIDLSSFGPYYGDATSSLAQFRRTLDAVARLDARVWITSHHKGVLTDRAQFLNALARFAARIEERSAQLCAMLAEGPQDLQALVRRGLLYPRHAKAVYVDSAERATIGMHLDELLAQERVRLLDDGRYALA